MPTSSKVEAGRPSHIETSDGRATAARGATFVAAACACPGGHKLVRLFLLRSVVGFLSSMCLRLCVAPVCLKPSAVRQHCGKDTKERSLRRVNPAIQKCDSL